jgi:hypothetical protein
MVSWLTWAKKAAISRLESSSEPVRPKEGYPPIAVRKESRV